MDVQLGGRAALVVGGASGLGAATAAMLAAEGAQVAIIDRVVEGIAPNVFAIEADVRDANAVESAVADAVARFGGLDCAVNCAGVQQQKPMLEMSASDWSSVVDVNLLGVWNCIRAQIPYIAARGGGAIVNVASTAGIRAFPMLAPYTASKHGVVGLSRAASLEAAPLGVRVNCICPGIMRTPMAEGALADTGANVEAIAASIPMGRWGEPDEFAALAVWLCSPASSYVTGTAIAVDGGIVQY